MRYYCAVKDWSLFCLNFIFCHSVLLHLEVIYREQLQKPAHVWHMSVYFIFSASPFVYSSYPQRNLSNSFFFFSPSPLGRSMWRWMVCKGKGSARKIFITLRLIEIALNFFFFFIMLLIIRVDLTDSAARLVFPFFLIWAVVLWLKLPHH